MFQFLNNCWKTDSSLGSFNTFGPLMAVLYCIAVIFLSTITYEISRAERYPENFETCQEKDNFKEDWITHIWRTMCYILTIFSSVINFRAALQSNKANEPDYQSQSPISAHHSALLVSCKDNLIVTLSTFFNIVNPASKTNK